MIAKVSVAPTTIIEETENCQYNLRWLSEHGRKSKNPDERGNHNDGSGIAFIHGNSIVVEKRGKANFWNQSYHDVLAKTTSRIFIVHNRDASSGLLTNERGAHPFVATKNGEQLAFCHNGSITSFMEEAKEKNISDSEIFFHKILDGISNIDEQEVFMGVRDLAETCEYTSMTGYLITRNGLFAWRIYNDKDPVHRDRLARAYTQYLSIRNNWMLLSSEPLDSENWMLLENRAFIHVVPEENGLHIGYKKL